MTAFLQVLRAETAKLRRTTALKAALCAPLIIVVLYCSIGLLSPAPFSRQPDGAWASLVRNSLSLWSVLMLPLFITLVTSLIAGLEHTERNWKLVLTLPVPRWMVYVAKLVVVTGVVWLAHLILGVGTLASGWLLRAFSPELRITAVPVAPLASGLAAIASSLVLPLAIQHWVSIRWSSFTVAIGFGMVAMVLGFLAVNHADIGPWYPWSLPMFAVAVRDAAVDPRVYSLVGGVLVTLAGSWQFSRRDVH